MDYGIGWYDANKTVANTEDDEMCWAAAASNILAWGNWNAGMTVFSTEDAIFQHYQNHWTDDGGLMEFGWEWWINGTNSSPTVPGWSQVDVAGGVPADGFWPQYNFYDYYYRTWEDDLAMQAIDGYLHAGYGTTIGIYTEDGGHALTIWGYDYDDQTGDYTGLIFSDSDDYLSADGSYKNLWLSSLSYDTVAGKWYIGGSNWYIGEVMALEGKPVPEPGTLVLLGFGLIGLAACRIRRK
ncbi:MAG: PEP-CTERM sorting domain-containing protein [Deltaproteobacteria bacterium]|nr:PEP-CTERM sorting domain-containing protein [Deltaproteobacteria bacterium]